MKALFSKKIVVILFVFLGFSQIFAEKASGLLRVRFSEVTSNLAVTEFFASNQVQKVVVLDAQSLSNQDIFSGGYVLGQTFMLIFPEEMNIQNVVNQYQFHPKIETINQPQAIKTFFTPNDPLYLNGSQNVQSDLAGPYLEQLNLEKAWDIIKADSEIVIAIIDSGTNINHEEFIGKIKGSYNVIDNTTDVSDFTGQHGTTVAGIAAAHSHNAKGIASPAFGASIYPIKVFPNELATTLDFIVLGIQHAIAASVDVINISIGGLEDKNNIYVHNLRSQINQAAAQGIVTVVSAGNTQDDYFSIDNFQGKIMVPAAIPNTTMVTVGGAQHGQHTNRSLYGPSVDVIAPFFVSSAPFMFNNQSLYSGVVKGTSYSSPLVAGVVALMKRYNPNATAAQIERALELSADDRGLSGKDDFNGHGFVDAFRALAFIDPQVPSATLTNYPINTLREYGSTTLTANISDNFIAHTDETFSIQDLIRVTLNYQFVDLNNQLTTTNNLKLEFRSQNSNGATFSNTLDVNNQSHQKMLYSITYSDANEANIVNSESFFMTFQDTQAPIINFGKSRFLDLSKTFELSVSDNTAVSPNSFLFRVVQDEKEFSLGYDQDILNYNSLQKKLAIDFNNSNLNQFLMTLEEKKDIQFFLSVSDVFNNQVSKNHMFQIEDKLSLYAADYRSKAPFNGPNPFDPRVENTFFCFEISQASHVTIRVYSRDLTCISQPMNQELGTGYHEIEWNGRDFSGRIPANGVYFVVYEIKNQQKKIVKRSKLVILKKTQ